jgi:hypothetical protein
MSGQLWMAAASIWYAVFVAMMRSPYLVVRGA